MESIRIFHCTFYKCGSQWVRDVLTDPEIVKQTRLHHTESGRDVQSEGWPSPQAESISSPLYSAGIGDWIRRTNKSPGDRCLIVTRDPRDIVVSLVSSLGLSHAPTGATALLRSPIRSATPYDRLSIGCHLFTLWCQQFKSWYDHPLPEDEMIVDFAELVADEQSAFRRIFRYCGWEIPGVVATEVIARHSFVNTSGGRKPGEENEFSHHRKGISGDWRNHFSRELGETFEQACPELLRFCGFEHSDDWWRALPDELAMGHPARELGERERLLKALEEQETTLAILREAADSRLRDLETLHALYFAQQQETEMYRTAAEERLEVIRALS